MTTGKKSDTGNVLVYSLSPFRPSTRRPGTPVPGRQSSESRTNDTGSSVSVPPPLSRQDAAQALLHGGERHSQGNYIKDIFIQMTVFYLLNEKQINFRDGSNNRNESVQTMKIYAWGWAERFNLPLQPCFFSPLLPDQLAESPQTKPPVLSEVLCACVLLWESSQLHIFNMFPPELFMSCVNHSWPMGAQGGLGLITTTMAP